MQRHAGDGAAAVVAVQKPPRLLSLEVDGTFWKKYCALSEHEAGCFEDRSNHAHIFSQLPRIVGSRHQLDSYRGLCCFSSSMRRPWVDPHYHERKYIPSPVPVSKRPTLVFWYAIRALTSITDCTIDVSYSHALVNRSIVSALENHSL
jgi:hypothetical protein